MSSSNSSSSTTPNHGSAILTWEIENFSTTHNVQQSPKFSFPENDNVRFALECSPTIDLPYESGKFVVFNLCLGILSLFERPDLFAKPCIRYRIAILGTNGTRYYAQECQNTFIYFCTAQVIALLLKNTYNTQFTIIGGYLIKRDYLLDPANGLLINGKLTVYCEVDDNCLNKSLIIPLNPVLDDFRSLLKSGKFSDVVFLIDGKSLPVHKNILVASSEVFVAMFEHDFEEKKTNRVEITDVAVEVFQMMLDFIYTGQIPRLRDYATELFVVADKYQLKILRKSCENHLIHHLTSSTAAEILIIADMHQASDLKEACSAYICQNVKQVMATKGWKVLLTKADLMDELFSKVADKQVTLSEKVKSLENDIASRKGSSSNPWITFDSNSSSRSVSLSYFDDHDDHVNDEIEVCEISFEMKMKKDSLLESGKFSDAILVVGHEELPVHRNILCARSIVFAELFESKTRVQVDNIPLEACKELLRYIYTGEIGSNLNKFARHLLEASHKFQLNYLKAICEESLSYSIDLNSVVSKFLLADTNEADYLKRNCFDFICENVKQVIQTEGWKTLKQTHPEIAFELFERVAEKKW